MYKVLKFFTDLQDNNHAYDTVDTYPREGYTPTAERIAELSGSENLQKRPLIAPIENNLEKMKLDELQAYAKENNIELDGAKTKADILAKIKEAEEAKK